MEKMDIDTITLVPKGPAPDADAIVETGQEDASKMTYKSWKKKYRKMRIKFEESMNQSNILFKQEQQGSETARRIALENDQLLDLLLDVNNSAQIPGQLRIDLSLDTPPVEDLPKLVADLDPTNIKDMGSESQEVLASLRIMLEARVSAQLAAKPPKSLSTLMASTPHRQFPSDLKSYDLSSIPGLSSTTVKDLEFNDDGPTPVSYVSPDILDDSYSSIDASLNIPVAPTLTTNSAPQHYSDKELQVRNPNSVYNWLRRHEPRIFLQDGEGSEKSSGKPGALRGAGKRASIPAPSKPDTVEFVEEDGIGYDVTLGPIPGGTLKGKRKRAIEEDAGYRPKGGISRPHKKKKKEGDGTGSRRSSKGKVKAEVDTETEEMADVPAAE